MLCCSRLWNTGTVVGISWRLRRQLQWATPPVPDWKGGDRADEDDDGNGDAGAGVHGGRVHTYLAV
jgi:hypothetical protein